MAEDEYHFHDPEVGQEGPSFSIINILSSLKDKGLKGTITDRRLGPHVHLTLLLFLVILMTIISGIILTI